MIFGKSFVQSLCAMSTVTAPVPSSFHQIAQMLKEDAAAATTMTVDEEKEEKKPKETPTLPVRTHRPLVILHAKRHAVSDLKTVESS